MLMCKCNGQNSSYNGEPNLSIMVLYMYVGDCFNGRGRGYNGTISRTRSGKTCQRWSEQAPHQFILPSSQYPEIAGGHNYCRNPGSRAPDAPWCFTTDPNTRWEYCDVPKCGKDLHFTFY